MQTCMAGPLHPFLSVTADIAQRRQGPSARGPCQEVMDTLLNRAKANLGVYYHFRLWPGVQ
jgi:hypothetical protein